MVHRKEKQERLIPVFFLSLGAHTHTRPILRLLHSWPDLVR
jgi:hypothetical protein